MARSSAFLFFFTSSSKKAYIIAFTTYLGVWNRVYAENKIFFDIQDFDHAVVSSAAWQNIFCYLNFGESTVMPTIIASKNFLICAGGGEGGFSQIPLEELCNWYSHDFRSKS